jgi:hypothetical protein
MPPDDHRGAARIATLGALIVVAAFIVSKTARDAILLAHYDVKTLPIFMAISAVMSLPVILVAGRLMTRYGPARLVPWINAASALLAVVEWVLLQSYPQPIAALVFFHLAIAGAVLASGFWSIVNERFDVQNAKRHIGRIGVGATFGGIFGGILAERTAVYMSPDKILLVLAGMQLVSAVVLYVVGRVAHTEPIAEAPEGQWFAFRMVMKSQLLRNVGGIVVLAAVAAGILDYVFKADIVGGASKDGVLRSLAIFYTVTSVITAIVQAVVCGPLIARLGVPRSVATLPITITAFGLFALGIPVPLTAAIARGAEQVTHNSIFRAGYELLYAPLPEDHKRPTKIVLDVGADRLGDLLGAQLVGAIVLLAPEPRYGLLIAALATGVIAVLVTLRLPRSYTMALEDSLLAHAPDAMTNGTAAVSAEPEPWTTLSAMPSFGQAGELAPLPLRVRERVKRRGIAPRRPAPADPREPAPSISQQHDNIVDAIADLRSGDAERIRRTLAVELTPELAAFTIDLVGRDEVARQALAALAAVAPRCTGLLVDALLDREREVAVRRRLPGVLLSGEPSLASWGLWRALLDPSFDVRYRSGAVLARFAAAGQLGEIAAEDVFGIVRRELLAGRSELERACALDDLVAVTEPAGDDPVLARAGTGLEHVFTVLGLVLPAEPLRIALHAVQTDDPELRGTALEYLESILPADVRAQLWPLLEGDGAVVAPRPVESTAPIPEELRPAVRAVSLPMPHKPRTHDEIVAALRLSYPSIVEKLRQRAKPA